MKRKTYPQIENKKELLADTLKLPKDLILGASIITLTGNKEAWVENYKGIIDYSDKMILLQGKSGQICFSGKNLSIDYYTNEDMKISGCINQVQYLG